MTIIEETDALLERCKTASILLEFCFGDDLDEAEKQHAAQVRTVNRARSRVNALLRIVEAL